MARVANKKRARGAMIVEAALLFGLLLLLTFGVIEYGWILQKSQQITNAARQGARVAARANATNDDVTNVVFAVMNEAGMKVYTVVPNPLDVTTVPTGNQLTITVSVATANVDLAGSSLVPLPTTLSASATMVKEGP